MVDWTQDLFWAIDPGESKCGVAIFHQGVCVQALRSVPEECLDKLWEHLGFGAPSARPAGVVLEAFNLRGDLSAMQRGSEMGTSQMIGAIRWMCRHRQVPLVMQTPGQAHSIHRRLEPFKSWPQRRWVSYGQGFDAKMAEMHGYFRVSTSSTTGGRKEWLAQMAVSPSKA